MDAATVINGYTMPPLGYEVVGDVDGGERIFCESDDAFAAKRLAEAVKDDVMAGRLDACNVRVRRAGDADAKGGAK